MWNQICSFTFWLHAPEHVARFQRFFGIFPITNKVEPKLTNGLNHQQQHKRKITYDTNVLDECIEEIKHSSNQNSTPTDIDYIITNWFWYYFFQIGSALGNEIFYIVFFPTWIWNVDGCVARRVSILWAIFMYLGQATKDILAMPRPASPPVLQLEKRYG